MDRFHLESGNRMHENQSRLQALLCGAHGETVARDGSAQLQAGFSVSLHERAVALPLTWKKPQSIFVNSMSDVFHEDVPEAFIHRIFDTMAKAPWHIFQVLTKRAERLEGLGRSLCWPANVWMGVSVEAKDYLYRIDHLRNVGAQVKFISFEAAVGRARQDKPARHPLGNSRR